MSKKDGVIRGQKKWRNGGGEWEVRKAGIGSIRKTLAGQINRLEPQLAAKGLR